ncbi:MBL fold metallo-hydrolase [Pleionea sediminis]|uniref:MBL fold metallo-hydrolase n=1 Tax=Pleionea sediminis TaxID=2569479 RepID=UPI0011872322|nr:MBL fold metallo-hydrolase [Pleionea sediminis]
MSEFRCVSLGSGSKGNAILIVAGEAKVLVDCGFGIKELIKRLDNKGINVESLSAILVTHEHSDHASGVARVARKFGIPVFLSRGTHLHRSCEPIDNVEYLTGESEFSIGELKVLPFTVPHDAREPIQFVFSYQNKRLGLITDTGRITSHIVDVLSNTHTLLLEFNHDPVMLRKSKYPAALKQRIAGDYGHLSNQQALSLLEAMDKSQLKRVVAMHLSEENNCPDLVKTSFDACDFGIEFIIADQGEGTDWILVS